MKKWLIALMALASAATCSAADIAPSAHDDTVTLYFARHGKTLFNTFDRVQGWADTPPTMLSSMPRRPSMAMRKGRLAVFMVQPL